MTGHWAQDYVGLPWSPDQAHCWSFCRRVWRERFGLHVPEMPLDAEDLRACVSAFERSRERSAWISMRQPQEGCAVLMARARRSCHVGIWVEPGPAGILHALHPHSVFTPAGRLRDLGYRVVGFYQRTGQ